jgi:hypothetical protein
LVDTPTSGASDRKVAETQKMRSILDACFLRRPAGVEMALRPFQSTPLLGTITKNKHINFNMLLS